MSDMTEILKGRAASMLDILELNTRVDELDKREIQRYNEQNNRLYLIEHTLTVIEGYLESFVVGITTLENQVAALTARVTALENA